MKLGKETASLMNWMMSGDMTMPKAGEDGTELGWTDRRSFKVLEYDEKKKCGVAAYYKDCYDTHDPVGTEVQLWTFNFKFSRNKWRKSVDGEKYSPWNVIFGVRNGYYDLSF